MGVDVPPLHPCISQPCLLPHGELVRLMFSGLLAVVNGILADVKESEGRL